MKTRHAIKPISYYHHYCMNEPMKVKRFLIVIDPVIKILSVSFLYGATFCMSMIRFGIRPQPKEVHFFC